MASGSNEDEFGRPNFRIQEVLQCDSISPNSVVPLQNGNFLLANEKGQVYQNANESIKSVAEFDSSIQITFCNNCVVLISKHGIAFRYVSENRHVPLRELSYVSSNDNQFWVEISREEACVWTTELKDSAFYTNINQFLQKCQKHLNEIMNDDEYLIIEIEDVRGLATNLAELIHHYVELQAFESPLISYACMLLDKLRFFIDPYAPYNGTNPPRFTEEKSDAEDLVHYSVMNAEAARYLSFYKWHRTDCLYANPKSLAAAGFFHRPNSTNLDRVACFSCTVCLVNWESQDDPIQEHSKHSRHSCRFIQKSDLQNIPFEATLSHLPFYKWSKIFETPDLQLNPNDLIVGHLTPETSWFAVAVPSTSQQTKPSIFLFDTSKVASKPIEILLDLYATSLSNQLKHPNAEHKRSFDWLNRVEEETSNKSPLCEIHAMCTSTTFDECTVTLRGERIVGLLCTAVGVDENRLKCMQSQEDISNIDTSTSKRRPFLLVHHIVEFPDDNCVLAVEYVQEWVKNWVAASTQNKFESFYGASNWTNEIPPANDSPIDALVLYDDKSDSYAEITKETSKPLNEDVFYNPMNVASEKPPEPDHLPIYYNEKKAVAIGIQCLRLPEEFDSSDYQIDCVVSSSTGNLFVAAINSLTQNGDTSSALLVYSCVPMLNLLQEVPVSKILFKNGRKIKTVHVLGKDYFSTSGVKRENALSTEALNDTVCILFDDGSLHVVDLDFGQSVQVDVAPLKTVNLAGIGEIFALTMDNKLINIEVQNSMPCLNRDVTEEQVISFLSAIENHPSLANSDVCLIEKLRHFLNGSSKLTNIESLLQSACSWCPVNFKQLYYAWSLTRSESLIRSHHTMTTSSSTTLPTSPLLNTRSHTHLSSQQAVLQSNLGLTVQTPHEFVEFNLHNGKERCASNPTILSTTTCQQFCVLNKVPYSDLTGLNVDATRTWQIKPRRESSKKSFVFEMSLMFGLNLSHVNLTFGLGGFVRGVSDIQISVYIPRSSSGSLNDEAMDLFASSENPILAGPTSGLPVENFLGMLSSKPHLLEQKFQRCLGPIGIEEFADANGKQATIQLSVVQLLLAAARSKYDTTSKEIHYEKDWMFRSQRFYIHVEANERRTIQQKAYQTALQNAQADQQKRELYQSIGGSKRSRMTTSAGGHVPLPYKTASDRKKQQMKSRNGSSRKRFVHVSNLVAETVMSALKPYTGDASKNETILSCFEYLTISAYKTIDSNQQSRLNMQRCLFALDIHAHVNIFKMAAGISSEIKNFPYYRFLIAQQQALDVLTWLLTQWRVSKDNKRIAALSNVVQEIVPQLIQNCYVVPPRTIARKTTAFLVDLLDLTQQNNNKLSIKLLKQISSTFSTKRFCFSASLQWLMMLARSIVKNACLQSNNVELANEQLMQAVIDLNKTCIQIVQNTGKIWRSRRSNSTYKVGEKLIDLEALEEMKLYNAPSLLSVLIIDPSLIATAHNNAKLSFSTFKNATSNFAKGGDENMGNDSSTVARSFFDTAMHFESNPSSTHSSSKSKTFGSKQASSANNNPNEHSKDGMTPLATIYLLDGLDENELKWHEHLGINSLETPVYPTKKALTERVSNPLGSGRSQTTQSSITQSTSQQQQTSNDYQQNQSTTDLLVNKQSQELFDELCNKHGAQNVHRFLMGSEQMPGLNEVERLNFNVISATCQLRILNLNAPKSSQTSAESPQIVSELGSSHIQSNYYGFPSTSTNKRASITDVSKIAFDPKNQSFVPAQSKNLQTSASVDSHQNQLQSAAETYLLERQRIILEKSFINASEKSHPLPTPLTNPFIAFAPTVNESEQLDSKASSTLVFDEMENEDKVFTTDDLFNNQMDVTEDSTFMNVSIQGESTINGKKQTRVAKLTKRTPIFVMEMDSCQSGQLIQIVLDFHVPFLLTDLVVPSNEIFSAVAIDGWLDEKHQTTRFAYTTEIENRPLILNDLSPTTLIRYVRLSFTTRDCRRTPTTFMPGQFYGTHFFSPWQFYQNVCKDGLDNSLKRTLEQHEMNFFEFDGLATQMHARYQANLGQLKKLTKQPGAQNVQQAYQKCLIDRQLYNYLRTTINRSVLDMKSTLSVLNPDSNSSSSSYDWFGCNRQLDLERNTDSWWDATLDELSFASTEFMSLSNEIHNFLALNQQSVSNKPESAINQMRPKLNIEILDLESAVRLFGCFVCDESNAKLQATCCGFLFHHGSTRTSWWPDFFPAVIKKYFSSSSNDSLENIFVLLAFICDQSVRHHELQTPIVEKLLVYLQELINSPKTVNGSIDTTQLSWLLLLISTAFDIIVPNTKHTDRWSFVAGNTSSNYPHAPMPNENYRRYTRKIGSVAMKDQFWPHHYHNTGGFAPASTLTANGQFNNDDTIPMFVPSYQKYNSSSSTTSTLDHAAIIELKKLGNELRQIAKQLDTMLSNNQLNSDDFTPLKKEQKSLASLYTTSQAYINKSSTCINESFVDKILIGGLQKSELELENMKAPLATQEEDDTMSNADDAMDAAAKKQQQLETANANNIRNRLIKVKRALYLLVKQTKNAAKNKSASSNTTVGRSRRFAVRMQLPQQTVVQTIRVLLRLMCENSSLLRTPTQILLFKVCAKLGVHGCRYPISFKQMMESVQMTKNLLSVVIENSTSWTLHSLIAFLLDISEAENPSSTAASNEPSTSAMEFEPQSSVLSKKDTDMLAVKASDFLAQLKDGNGNVEPMEEDLPNSDKKRRKEETPANETEIVQSTSTAIPEEKDSSPVPMEDENATTSTSTYVTNVDDDETLCEAKSAMNNLSIVSPTILTSGLISEQSFVCGPDLNSITEERELHLGLLDERTEIGENPQYPFAFTLFDKPNEADIDMLIIMTLFGLKPIEKKNLTYWDNYRSWFLRQIGYAVVRARYERGEPLHEIFRWLDYVMGAELEAANNCKSENSYVKWGVLSLIHASDFIEREFDLNGKKLEFEKSPSHSALQCGTYFSQFYNIHDNTNNAELDEEPLLDSLDDKFYDVFGKLLGSARDGSFVNSLCSIIEQRRKSGATDHEEHDELTDLCDSHAENYLAVDSSEDAAHLVAMRGFLPLHKSVFLFSRLRFIQSLIQVRRCVKNLGFAHLPEINEIQMSSTNKKTEEKSRRRKTQQLESMSDSSSAEKLRAVEAVLDERMEYNIKMSVNFLNTRFCPVNLGFNQSTNMDLCIYNTQRKILAERLVTNCLFLHKMSPNFERKVKTSVLHDSKAMSGVETCANLVVEAVNRLLTELDVEKANELPARTHRNGSGQFLLNLVNFFWDFQGNVIANKSQNTESMCIARNFVLNEKAIGNLLRFAVEYDHMNEQIWLHLFKILNALDTPVEDNLKESKSYKFTHWIENSPYFAKFIERFFNSSMGKFNLVSSTRATYGPAIQNVFGRFTSVLFKQISSRTMDNLLTVLTKNIRNSRECGFVNFPIEMINELTSNFDKMDRICQCSPSIFAQFISATMELTSDFFIEVQRIHRHYPEETLQQNQSIFASDLQSIPSNVCFSAVLSSSSVRERNMSVQDRLRVYNTGSASKNTKNIAFTKRADLLENGIRDGEIATKDMFTMTLYSFLRLCVRYVSQFKPQVLKAILQEQPKTLSRAIDMLFTFVSHTSSIDDITVENFKVVSLADAVIHFLLVISEYSIDDVESSRLFIRFVINSLRNRVSLSAQSNDQSNDNNNTLMDLPIPVLLLIKSLLSSVSRCQIFIDEDGHTFVADQLQRSLDSISNNWPGQTHFENLSGKLNALASSITGIEPMNPLLNSTPPAQIPSSQSNDSSTNQGNNNQNLSNSTTACTSSFHGSILPPTTSSSQQQQTPSFGLKYPTVSMQSTNAANNNPPFGVPNAQIVSMQIVNIKNSCLQPSNTPTETDELYNFAPVSTIRSDAISPAQLSLLNQNLDLNNKRNNRNPPFTYRFPPKKQWFDLTMVLPYKIVLHEVIIRAPETNGSINAPSAVQIELSTDGAQASWQVLSCPVCSDNPSYYRISTSAYKLPVTGVRLHFGCPNSSSTLNLSQIQLLGSTSIRSMKFLSDSSMFESQLVYHWVSLFSKLYKKIDVPDYAPTKLAESLVKVFFLGKENHNQKTIFNQVYELLSHLDQKDSTKSLVTIIVNYLIDGGRICPKVYPSASELLYSTCLPSTNTAYYHRYSAENRLSNPSNEVAILRQRELLTGIQKLLSELLNEDEMFEEENLALPEVVCEIAIFIWSAACVLWQNSSDKELRYDTIALCLEIGPSIIPKLTRFIIKSPDNIFYRASCWLLCTFARVSSELQNQIFDCLGVNEIMADEISIMRILGKICQSTSAAQFLIDKKLVSNWSNTAIEIAREEQHIRIDELSAIVECFQELAVIEVFANYFDNTKGELLFRSLIRYVISCSVNGDGQKYDQNINSHHSKLLWTVIGFIKRCMTTENQRKRVAKIIADLLKSNPNNQKGVPLSSSFLNVVLKLIVEDEKIMVRLTGVVTDPVFTQINFENQMFHPLFGCIQDDRLIELPLSTLCRDLLPHTKKSSSNRSSKMLAPYDDDFPFGNSFKTVFAPDEFEEKEAISPKETYSESSKTKPDYPYLFKHYAIQIGCDTLSKERALNNKWSLEMVLSSLRLIQQLNNDKKMETEPASLLDTNIDPNDGYLTLNLNVKASIQKNLLPLVEENPSFGDQLKNVKTPPSTLMYFAQFDGLKYLSKSVSLMSRIDDKLKMLTRLTMPLPDLEYIMVKKEISTARESLRNCTLRTTESMSSNNNALNNYHLLYEAMEKPTLNIYNASQMLNRRGVQFLDVDQTLQTVSQQQSKSGVFNNYDYFDSIDGIPIGNTDEEMLSMFDFMSEAATSSSSPKTTIKTGGNVASKTIAPTYSQAIGLLSALPMDDDEFMGITDSLDGFVPIHVPAVIATDSNFSSDIYGQITAQLQGQLASLSELASKIQTLNSSVTKTAAYPFNTSIGTPAKQTRSTSSETDYSEHVMIALSLFLEIDTYGQTLVEYDYQSAKRLIYLLLGMEPPVFLPQSYVAGLTPLLPRSQAAQDADAKESQLKQRFSRTTKPFPNPSYYSNLYLSQMTKNNNIKLDDKMLVPFIVLSRCFENATVSKVGAEKAEQIRTQALNNGTIDVLLTLLSHYSNQRPLKQPIRPEGDFLVTQLISRLFLFHSDVQATVAMFNDAQRRKRYSGKGSSFPIPKAPKPFSSLHGPTGSSSNTGPNSASIIFGGSSQNAGSKDYWAKGTGFGSGSTTGQFNLATHMSQQKQNELVVAYLLNVLANFINPQPIASTYRIQHITQNEEEQELIVENTIKTDVLSNDPTPLKSVPYSFIETIQRSCLGTNLNTFLMNDSVLDISNHATAYEACLGLLLSAYTSGSTVVVGGKENVPLSDLIINSTIETTSGSPVYERLKNLISVLDVYISKLGKPDEPSTSETSAKKQEENLADLLKVGNIVIDLMEKRIKNKQEVADEDERMDEQNQLEILPDLQGYYSTGRSLEHVYMETLKTLQYQTVDFFNTDGITPLFPYHYSSSLSLAQTGGGKRIRRLAQESASLLNSLPLSLSSSVFVCLSSERLDTMKVLLTGPEGTPYSGGCFEFDVFFPTDYPTVPMQMNLQTTGARSVRFNPNLYDDGKVCLSILNTWSGRPEERWNSQTSSFLQVLVSIQSLILVPEPFFNEPGFERTRGTPSGDQSSRDYTANIRHQCIRWAMVEQLRKPIAPFAQVIRKHFWLKRDEICLQIRGWIDETKEFIAKNPIAKQLPSHLTLMEKNFESLLAEFAKMECPEGLSHCKSKYVQEYIEKKQQQK